MLHRHVFDRIFTEFRGISRIYLNFAAPRPHEISEGLIKTLKDVFKFEFRRIFSFLLKITLGHIIHPIAQILRSRIQRPLKP